MARLNAKRLCRTLNDTFGDPDNLGAEALAKHRSELVDSLLAKCDPSAIEVEPPFWCDYGFNISLGKGFYCNYNCCILGNFFYIWAKVDCAKVTIGDRVNSWRTLG